MASVVTERHVFLALLLPVAAPVVTATVVGIAKTRRYGGTQAQVEGKEAVNKKSPSNQTPFSTGLDAVKSALKGVRSTENFYRAWGTVTKGLQGVTKAAEPSVDTLRNWGSVATTSLVSAVKGLHSSIGLPGCSTTVAVAHTAAANSVRVSILTPEVLLKLAGMGLLPHGSSPYTVFLCLSAADGKYVLDFVCSNEQQVLDLKRKLLATVPCLENDVTSEFLALQVSTKSSKYRFSLPSRISLENFVKIKDYIQGRVNSTLTGNWFGHVTSDMKVIIEFFCKHDLTWALKLTNEIVRQINYPPVEGVLSGFYHFNQDVIKKALSYEMIQFSQFKLTPGDILHMVTLCINRQPNVYSTVEKLCRDHILHYASTSLTYMMQGSDKSPNGTHTDPTDGEILRAASKTVGSELSETNSVIARVNGDVFVIITDRKVHVSVVRIICDEESGAVTSVATRQSGDSVINAGCESAN